ncbi:MAG: hypothetical protein ACRD19_08405, partial [Terriglobia bacterium]
MDKAAFNGLTSELFLIWVWIVACTANKEGAEIVGWHNPLRFLGVYSKSAGIHGKKVKIEQRSQFRARSAPTCRGKCRRDAGATPTYET